MIKYVLFDPSQRTALAHYSQLETKDTSLSLQDETTEVDDFVLYLTKGFGY